MKNISKYFLVGVITIILFLFLIGKFDSCLRHSTTPTKSTAQNTIDSILKEKTVAEIKHKNDSFLLSKKIDSIKTKYKSSDSSLNATRTTVRYLNNELKKANALNDTSMYYEYCNELSAEIKILDSKIEDYKNQVDTLNKTKDSLQLLTQKKSDDYLNLLNSFRKVSRQLTSDNDSLITANKKLFSKANKKFSIGIGGSAGLTNYGTPGGSIGITIQRTIIRL